MRFWKINDESGSATIDFIVFGLVASAGILLASQTLGEAQHRQFVAQQFSKQLGRTLIANRNLAAAQSVVNQLAESYQISSVQLSYTVACVPACTELSKISPGALIDITAVFEQAQSHFRVRASR